MQVEAVELFRKQSGEIVTPGDRLDLSPEKAAILIKKGRVRAIVEIPGNLLHRIKALLANGPILYSEVLTRTGATEGEIREAIRNWYGLISGRIQGKGEEFYWWIDSESSRGDRL